MDKLTENVAKRFKKALEELQQQDQSGVHQQDQQGAITRPTPLAQDQVAVAPPGWENTVKHMKKHDEIDNPWALAWYMKNKGAEPHHASSPKFLLAANEAFKRHQARAAATMRRAEKLECTMEKDCKNPVSMIDNKGFLYCAHHGAQRKMGGVPCRKLSSGEIKKLERDESIRYS
jgi:hypothetical protein